MSVRVAGQPLKRLAVLVALLGALGTSADPVVGANTWCFSNFPDAAFCDDFDRYCVDPPSEPQACAVGSTPDAGTFERKWLPGSRCVNAPVLDETFYTSPPWGARTNCQDKSVLGYASRAISDSLRNAYGPAYGSAMGTDLNPLVLEVTMHGQLFGKAKYDNSFLAFGSNFETPSVDWAYSDWCMTCGSPDPRYPVICQQETPAATCPPISGAPHVAAIAVGFVAHLDPNPCHCGESGDHSPYNEHLSFFDGYKWYRLRQGLFPGSGDFRVRDNQNQVKITIKLTTFKLELTTPDTGEYSWCELPRDYMGCFNSLFMGYPLACQLKADRWICRDDPVCAEGVPGGAVPSYDNIVVHGGVGCSAKGACCLPAVPDYACTEEYYLDCESLGGTFKDHATTCEDADVSCCPPLPADHDVDGDVDQVDFAWFQSCLSGYHIAPPTFGCRCADFNRQYDVDQEDFVIFQRCITGPEVPQTDPDCGS